MGTIDAGAIAVGRYFNLNPVQSRAPDFVQLPFKPFKHVISSKDLDTEGEYRQYNILEHTRKEKPRNPYQDSGAWSLPDFSGMLFGGGGGSRTSSQDTKTSVKTNNYLAPYLLYRLFTD